MNKPVIFAATVLLLICTGLISLFVYIHNEKKVTSSMIAEARIAGSLTKKIENLEPLFDPKDGKLAIFKLYGDSEDLAAHKAVIEAKIEAWSEQHGFKGASLIHLIDPSFHSVVWTFILVKP